MSSPRRIPRWAKAVLWVLVSLVVIFYAAGGWVFSSMLYSDALAPQPPTPDNGVWVRTVEDDRITLAAAEEREDITRPGVAGLAWEGGYGQIGEIETIESLEVTRAFTLVTGSPPEPCSGALTACDPVDIEGWTFQTDPADVGLDFSEVSYDSALGPMGAWRVDAGEGAVWAIHAHGWRSSRREAIRSLPIYAQSGITSLVIDYRNDPEAPADPTGIYRFGLSEWEDVQAAAQYALDQGAEKVILVGYSTGAAVHLSFLENSGLADQVEAVVFDSPNADMGAAVRLGASNRSIPGTSIPVPSSLTAVAMWIADLRWNVSWGEIDYIERVDEYLAAPTLVFHGPNDDRVRIDEARRLASEAGDLVRLVEVEGAGHVTSWNVDPIQYARTVTAFLGEQGLTTSVAGR